jgi:hypothetical protein
MENIKGRLQLKNGPGIESTRELIMDIYKKDGFRSFFRGYWMVHYVHKLTGVRLLTERVESPGKYSEFGVLLVYLCTLIPSPFEHSELTLAGKSQDIYAPTKRRTMPRRHRILQLSTLNITVS